MVASFLYTCLLYFLCQQAGFCFGDIYSSTWVRQNRESL